jgi:succinate dehydrogenase / fumarate reductase iron-sulfur subunit
MNITLNIKRFNPETDNEPYFKEYSLKVEPADRVLDALIELKRTVDSTLTVRKSCAHGVCGSDAMLINGIEALACKTLIQDVVTDEVTTIKLEPLRAFPVQRDLYVDLSEFFEKYKSINPYLIAKKEIEEKEFIQSQAERDTFEDPTKCILCSACYSSCPIVREKNPGFIGPAASAQASRFIFDTRDKGIGPRLKVLDDDNGVYSCDNHFNCTKVCPRGIKITKNINMVKREIKKNKEAENQTL